MIDCSLSALKSAFKAECKEQREFRKVVMGFIGSNNDGTSKWSYDNSPIGRSYIVSKFNILYLFFFTFESDTSLIYLSWLIDRFQMIVEFILILVIVMSTVLCHCIASTGT